MKIQFKKILEILDDINESNNLNSNLFTNQSAADSEDLLALENWSGKTLDEINKTMSQGYAKHQIKIDPFINMEASMHSPINFIAILPGEKPSINYSIQETPYGNVIIGSTARGICYLVFYSGKDDKLRVILEKEFPGSMISNQSDEIQEKVLDFINGNTNQIINLHLKGTKEQLQIWQALTKVSAGKLISYGTLGKETRQTAQDIGVAMAENRIAILIPCHRVIKATGDLGQYHWGARRKQAMILKEAMLH